MSGGQSELTELPSGSKLDVEGNKSSEDESEEDEGEDDDDGEEEEDEEEEEEEDEDDDDDEEEEDDDDEDENEDGEEDDEEEDEEEEAAVACETTNIPGLPKTIALDTAEQSGEADENIKQPGWDKMEDCVSGDNPLEVRTDQEQEAPEKMDVKETIPEKPLFGGPIPGILDLDDGCLVSAVRVEARFSDEEDNEGANESPNPTSLPSVDRTSQRNPMESKNENHSDDDDDWEDDDDQDEELLRIEKNSLEVEASQGTTLVCEDAQLQDQTDDILLRPTEGIADLDASSLDVPSASPKSKAITTADDDEDDWDDVDEEEEAQTKKPLNLFLNLLGQKEPESPEVSWESGSDKSAGTPEEDKDAKEMPSGEKDQHQEALVQDDNGSKRSLLEPIEHLSQSPLHEEPVHMEHSDDDSEAIPVSMIVGQSDEDQSISQEEDSQVKQMQYDFASGSVKVSEIDQISDVSDDESMVEENDGCIDDASQPHTPNLSNSSPKHSTTSSPAQLEKPVLSGSPNPLKAMSPVPTSPKSPTNPSPRQSAGPSLQHSAATSPQNSSFSSRSPSPQHCSPSASTLIHFISQDLDQKSQEAVMNPESQRSSPNSHFESDLSVEFADERLTEVIEPEPALQEEIPYTVIDEVDLTSDGDDDKEEELEQQNSVNEERHSEQGSLQVL